MATDERRLSGLPKPQGSFSTWVDLRRARLGAKAIGFDFAALPGWRAAQWVDDRVGSADLVVIDAPPHAETEARIAVRAARLVVVPVQPSPLDLCFPSPKRKHPFATGDRGFESVSLQRGVRCELDTLGRGRVRGAVGVGGGAVDTAPVVPRLRIGVSA